VGSLLLSSGTGPMPGPAGCPLEGAVPGAEAVLLPGCPAAS